VGREAPRRDYLGSASILCCLTSHLSNACPGQPLCATASRDIARRAAASRAERQRTPAALLRGSRVRWVSVDTPTSPVSQVGSGRLAHRRTLSASARRRSGVPGRAPCRRSARRGRGRCGSRRVRRRTGRDGVAVGCGRVVGELRWGVIHEFVASVERRRPRVQLLHLRAQRRSALSMPVTVRARADELACDRARESLRPVGQACDSRSVARSRCEDWNGQGVLDRARLERGRRPRPASAGPQQPGWRVGHRRRADRLLHRPWSSAAGRTSDCQERETLRRAGRASRCREHRLDCATAAPAARHHANLCGPLTRRTLQIHAAPTLHCSVRVMPVTSCRSSRDATTRDGRHLRRQSWAPRGACWRRTRRISRRQRT
jgi:hypothetical protein